MNIKKKKMSETGENKEKGRQLYGITLHTENEINGTTCDYFETCLHKYYFVSVPGNLP